MKIKNSHIRPFLMALITIVNLDWKQINGRLAEKACISGGYLSEILQPKKIPSLKVAHNLAKACGYNYESFVQYGSDIIERNETIPSETLESIFKIGEEIGKGKGLVSEKKAEILIEQNKKIIENLEQIINKLYSHLKPNPSKINGDIIDFKNPDKVRHHKLINKFPNTKDALEMNELAVEYAQKNSNAIKEIIKYIKFQMSEIKEARDSLGEAKNHTGS